jgi:hypothetical protein
MKILIEIGNNNVRTAIYKYWADKQCNIEDIYILSLVAELHNL